jgi:hypothetical protein
MTDEFPEIPEDFRQSQNPLTPESQYLGSLAAYAFNHADHLEVSLSDRIVVTKETLDNGEVRVTVLLRPKG